MAQRLSIASMIFLVAACGAPAIEDNLDTDDSNLGDRNPVTPGADAGPDQTNGASGPQTSTLTVTLVGAGTGSVASTPVGLACTGKTCTGTFTHGLNVTVTPTPGAGSLFAGWGGGCTGAAGCATLIAGDVAITADFGSLEGAWTGTYTNARTASGCNFTNAGNLSVTVKAAGAALSSSASMTGLQLRSIPSCNVAGATTGAAPDSAITMATDTLTGTWTLAVASGGSLAFPFTAKVVDQKLTGTWTCPTCTGSFTLTKP